MRYRPSVIALVSLLVVGCSSVALGERVTDCAESGIWTSWYENGQKKEEGAYSNEKKEGKVQ